VSEKFEDIKGVIRSRKSKDRQQIAMLNRDKRTNNDISTKHCSEN